MPCATAQQRVCRVPFFTQVESSVSYGKKIINSSFHFPSSRRDKKGEHTSTLMRDQRSSCGIPPSLLPPPKTIGKTAEFLLLLLLPEARSAARRSATELPLEPGEPWCRGRRRRSRRPHQPERSSAASGPPHKVCLPLKSHPWAMR